jgi:hypothetical protein
MQTNATCAASHRFFGSRDSPIRETSKKANLETQLVCLRRRLFARKGNRERTPSKNKSLRS